MPPKKPPPQAGEGDRPQAVGAEVAPMPAEKALPPSLRAAPLVCEWGFCSRNPPPIIHLHFFPFYLTGGRTGSSAPTISLDLFARNAGEKKPKVRCGDTALRARRCARAQMPAAPPPRSRPSAAVSPPRTRLTSCRSPN